MVADTGRDFETQFLTVGNNLSETYHIHVLIGLCELADSGLKVAPHSDHGGTLRYIPRASPRTLSYNRVPIFQLLMTVD